MMGWSIRRAGWSVRPGSTETWVLVIAGCVVALIAAVMLISPLNTWDAQSIWFLHSKLIVFARSTGADAGWSIPELEFTRPSYPRLNAVLSSAFFFDPLGGALIPWSERASKFSLVILLLLQAAGVFALQFRRGILTLAMLLILLVFPGQMTWTGYMDLWCAGFAVLGALHFWRGVEREDGASSLQLAVLFLALSIHAKNEGKVAAFSVILAAIVTGLYSRFQWPWRRIRSLLSPVSGVAVVSVAAWVWVRWRLELQDWLGVGSAGFFGQVWVRIQDGKSLPQILKTLLVLKPYAGIALFLALVGSIVRRRERFGAISPTLVLLLAGVFYTIALVLVYLGTPFDLKWHLATSSDRVTLMPIYCWLLAWLSAVTNEIRD